jgi:hypothetical protein
MVQFTYNQERIDQLKKAFSNTENFGDIDKEDINELFDIIEKQQLHIVKINKQNLYLNNEIKQSEKEKEEYRLEICRLYDKYCQPK